MGEPSGKTEKLFVVGRCRPLNQKEQETEACVRIDDDGHGLRLILTDPASRKEQVFDQLDAVVDSRDPEDSRGLQPAVYTQVGKRCVDAILGGFNCCLFAYGQTGTGKSHTLVGSLDDARHWGILPRACHALFEQKDVVVTASFVELYNDTVRDLLVPAHRPHPEVQVHSHPKLGTYLTDLQNHTCQSAAEILECCRFGCSQRSVSATAMNAQSSRGHSVFQLRVEQPVHDEHRQGTLYIVDLAGHENEKKTQAKGERLKELSFINSSLFHLREVISKLAEKCRPKGNPKALVPFRNSKLTLLLAHGLEGTGRCNTVVTLSPSGINHEENLATLRFAQDLTQIKVRPVPVPLKKGELVDQLRAEVQQLQAALASHVQQDTDEVAHLKAELAQAQKLHTHLEERWSKTEVDVEAERQQRFQWMQEQGLILVPGDHPYLVNLSDDPHLSGSCLFQLAEGDTCITTPDAQEGPSVVLRGLGIEPRMCTLRRTGLGVEACPRPPFARVLLNGRRLVEPVALHHGDRLLFGNCAAFQVRIPGEEAPPPLDLVHALDEVADETAEFQRLVPYIELVLAQVGEHGGKAFVKGMHQVAALVHEANDLSQRVRPDASYAFEVHVALDLEHVEELVQRFAEYVVVIVTTRPPWRVAEAAQAEVADADEGDAQEANEAEVVGATSLSATKDEKLLWSLPKFQRRLAIMRHVYAEHVAGRDVMGHLKLHPNEDPWLEHDDEEAADDAFTELPEEPDESEASEAGFCVSRAEAQALEARRLAKERQLEREKRVMELRQRCLREDLPADALRREVQRAKGELVALDTELAQTRQQLLARFQLVKRLLQEERGPTLEQPPLARGPPACPLHAGVRPKSAVALRPPVAEDASHPARDGQGEARSLKGRGIV